MLTPRTDQDVPITGALDLVVVIAVVAGMAVGTLVGILIGDARTLGAVGAMTGLVAGLALAVMSPRSRRCPATPGRHN